MLTFEMIRDPFLIKVFNSRKKLKVAFVPDLESKKENREYLTVFVCFLKMTPETSSAAVQKYHQDESRLQNSKRNENKRKKKKEKKNSKLEYLFKPIISWSVVAASVTITLF
jgi:hypothetical protein